MCGEREIDMGMERWIDALNFDSHGFWVPWLGYTGKVYKSKLHRTTEAQLKTHEIHLK